MKNAFALITVFLGLSNSIASISDIEIIDILTHKESYWGPPDVGWGITFLKNDRAIYKLAWEGSREIVASYKVSNEVIHISMFDIMHESDLKMFHKHSKCKLATLPNSLEYLYELQCDNGLKFPGQNYRSINQERTYDGIPVITLGGIDAKTLETVKFRKKPSNDSPTIRCKLQKSGGYSEGGVIPKDYSKISLVAKTRDKYPIGKWNNYWYFIRVYAELYDGERCDLHYGWLYGEFLKSVK